MPDTATRPAFSDDEAAIYDWFAANGVDEWVPDDFGPVEVDTGAGTLTYTAFTVELGGERGWGREWIGPGTERRTVALVEPPSQHIRTLVEGVGQAVVVA